MSKYPNWFKQTAQDNFEKHLKPLAGRKDLSALQIGAFTGDASIWLMKNLLVGPDHHLMDVDTWQGSDEIDHKEFDWEDVYKTYKRKLKPYPNAKHTKQASLLFLITDTGMYDFIYIDGSHTALDVFTDALLAWPHLEEGGILAFDDYVWHHPQGIEYEPQKGINRFVALFNPEVEILEQNTQLWLKKRSLQMKASVGPM